MKKWAIKLITAVIIVGALAMVLFSGLQGESLDDLSTAFRSMGPVWLILCLAGYAVNVLFDALGIWYFLRRQGHHVSLPYMIFVSVSGVFYSNITPGASGGQPMQVYYLHKRGVPVGLASSALIVRFFSFQFMLFVFGTVLWISHGAFIAEQVGGSRWLLIVGYVYNAVLVTGLVLITLRRGIVGFVIRLGLKLGVKLRLIRHPETAQKKCEAAVDAFHDSIGLLSNRPRDLITQMLIGAGQLMSQMIILYFIYTGLHQNGASFWQIIAMHVMEYTSAAYMPMPGASGAQEVTFSLYFGGIFPEGTRMCALLIWRFFTYYLSLITGGLITLVCTWLPGFKAKKEKK